MTTLSIVTVENTDPVTLTVDAVKAEECAKQLADPNAVLEFKKHNGMTYIPVRHIAYMSVTERGS